MANGIILVMQSDFEMNESILPIDLEQEDMPLILAIALKQTQLVFPDLIYTGKIESETDNIDDCELSLFARDHQGQPQSSQTISLEIIKVGEQRSLTAEYPQQENLPILWYGQHALWMDGVTGKTVTSPSNGLALERLCRGILKKLEDQSNIF